MEPAKSVDSGLCCLHHCNIAPQQHYSLADAETTVGLKRSTSKLPHFVAATTSQQCLKYFNYFGQANSVVNSLLATPVAAAAPCNRTSCSDALTCAKLRREMTIKMLSLIYRSRFEQSLSLSSSLSSTPQVKTRSESVGGRPPPPSLG
ncbi:hypothetical protein ACLKA6_006776 [Drosophila palustris]